MSHQKNTLDTIVHQILRTYQAKGKDLLEKFGEQGTDAARVENLYGRDEVKSFVDRTLPQEQKDAAMSKAYREKGNILFQKGFYMKALNEYNESIASAPHSNLKDQEKVLALGYANRSAALFHLKKFTECQNDIEKAFSNGYPHNMAYKLYDRKIKCMHQGSDGSNSPDTLSNALRSLEIAELSDKKKDALKTAWNKAMNAKKSVELDSNGTKSIHEFLPEVKHCAHAVYRSLSSACDVMETPSQGRFLVAKNEIKPGDVILVEKPYSSVVLLEQAKSYCSNCFSLLYLLVPCPGCCIVRYCSEKCLEEAQVYHKYECPIVELLHKSDVGKFGFLALRTVTKAGLEYLLEHKQQIDVRESPLRDGQYLADDYNAIYHLVSHTKDRTKVDLLKRGLTAVFLLHCLEHTNFFKPLEGNEREFKDKCYIGGLLLRHLQLLPCNAHEISELELNKSSVVTSLSVEVGAGIYSTLSLFNHSCDPNVSRNFYGDVCVVRAIKTISVGEEVADNYGAVYAVHGKDERQDKMSWQYYFKCACVPCNEDWPLYDKLESLNPNYKCHKCGCASTDKSTKNCGQCFQELDLKGRSLIVEQADSMWQDGVGKLATCDVEGAQNTFLKCLAILETNIQPPYVLYNKCHEALKHCYSMRGNCHEIIP